MRDIPGHQDGAQRMGCGDKYLVILIRHRIGPRQCSYFPAVLFHRIEDLGDPCLMEGEMGSRKDIPVFGKYSWLGPKAKAAI